MTKDIIKWCIVQKTRDIASTTKLYDTEQEALDRKEACRIKYHHNYNVLKLIISKRKHRSKVYCIGGGRPQKRKPDMWRAVYRCRTCRGIVSKRKIEKQGDVLIGSCYKRGCNGSLNTWKIHEDDRHPYKEKRK